MTRKEQREARHEARMKYLYFLRAGNSPKEAKVKLDQWGKATYGAVPWAEILAFLAPFIKAIIEKWLKV